MAQKARESARSLLPALKMTLPMKGMGKEARREEEPKKRPTVMSLMVLRLDI